MRYQSKPREKTLKFDANDVAMARIFLRFLVAVIGIIVAVVWGAKVPIKAFLGLIF